MTKALILRDGADTSHEDAREWYENYGWHLSTAGRGDVKHTAVEYDWLDDDDDAEVVQRLMDSMPARRARDENLTVLHGTELRRHEAESIVDMARTIRDSGEAIAEKLAEAVLAYQRDDCAGVVEALDEASSLELEHGDDPASAALREKLLEEVDDVGGVGHI